MVQNLEPNSIPIILQKKIIQNTEESTKFNQIYDDNFVSLINGLNESIKEYCKVSRNNIIEANSILSLYEQQRQAMQLLLEDITNSHSYERVNEVFEQIPKINDIISFLQMNVNSNDKNLNLFFDDAKILFKKMKMIRKQKIIEISNFNNNINKFSNMSLNDSFTKSASASKGKYASKNNLIKKYLNIQQNSPLRLNRINQNNNQDLNSSSFLMPFNKIYSQIMELINCFSEYNYIISKMNYEASNKYNNLQNNIKKELDILLNLVKNNFSNKNKCLNLIKSYDKENFDNGKKSPRITSGEGQEIEKLIKNNQIYEQKILELNNQIKIYKKNLSNIKNLNGLNNDANTKIRELEIKNNQLNLKLIKEEQILKEKDSIINEYEKSFKNSNNNMLNNNNFNLNNLIKQRDSQISNLQQQLYAYQSNENLLNNQITDLNKQFQIKINQYKSQIMQINNKNVSMSQMILNKDKEIMKLQIEKEKNKKEIDRLQKTFNINTSNQNQTPSQEETIQLLKNEINNYQVMINQYENRIKELLQKYNNNGTNIVGKNMNCINQNTINEIQFNAINAQNQKIIEDLKMKINLLNKEIINYQKKEKVYEDNNNKYIKQIEEMNNNFLYTNKIIEQKDELIMKLNNKKSENISDINNNNFNNINLELQKERDNYKFQYEQMQNKFKELLEQKNFNIQQNNNNNQLEMMKLENEKLQKEISELKAMNNNKLEINNNALSNSQIINGNNIQQYNLQNNEFIAKNKELTLENQKYKESLLQSKESIAKLESDINKKNEELEGLRAVIFKLQSKLEKEKEKEEDDKVHIRGKRVENKISKSSINLKEDQNISTTDRKNKKNKINNEHNKSFDFPKDANTDMINNILNKLNDAEKKINTLQNKNRQLQFQLEDKQVEKELSGYKTEDINYSNYEEEFDLKKMVNGARDKNRSEDINIDYPGVQCIKDKYKELLQNMNMLEEQVKLLILNINCNNKIKRQISQICQLMRIPAKNIQLIIAGKNKKKALGLSG